MTPLLPLPGWQSKALYERRADRITLPMEPQPHQEVQEAKPLFKGPGWQLSSRDYWHYYQAPPYPPGSVVVIQDPWRVWSWHEGEPIRIEYADGTRRDEADPPIGQDVEWDEWRENVREESSDDCEAAGIWPGDDGFYRIPDGAELPTRWRSAESMPVWCSRLSLHILEAQPVRLGEMTDEGAIAEGLPEIPDPDRPHRTCRGAYGNPYMIPMHAFMEQWSIRFPAHPWKPSRWAWSYRVERKD